MAEMKAADNSPDAAPGGAGTGESPKRRGLLAWMVGVFLSGMLTFLPIALTIAAIGWLAVLMEKYLSEPLRKYLPDYYQAGMGIVAFLVIVFLLGLLTRLWIVKSLVSYIGAMLMRVPLVKTVYGAINDVSDFIFKPAGGKQNGSDVVMAVLPGGWLQLGFVTRGSFTDLPEGLQREMHRCASWPTDKTDAAAGAAGGFPPPPHSLPPHAGGGGVAPAGPGTESGADGADGGPQMIAVYFPFSYQLGGFTYFMDRRCVRPVPGMTVEDVMRYSMMAWMAAKPK